jgi:hypothetical protein
MRRKARCSLPLRFPEKIQWRRVGYRVVSDLRDFPARIHAGREDLASFSEYGDPVALYEEVSLECTKSARDALAPHAKRERDSDACRGTPGRRMLT